MVDLDEWSTVELCYDVMKPEHFVSLSNKCYSNRGVSYYGKGEELIVPGEYMML